MSRPALANASNTAVEGWLGVERTFVIRISPVASSRATRSVKVPPVSTPALVPIQPPFRQGAEPRMLCGCDRRCQTPAVTSCASPEASAQPAILAVSDQQNRPSAVPGDGGGGTVTAHVTWIAITSEPWSVRDSNPRPSAYMADSGESAEGGSGPEPLRLAGDSSRESSAPVGANPDESTRAVGQAWDAALGSLAIDDDPRLRRGPSVAGQSELGVCQGGADHLSTEPR